MKKKILTSVCMTLLLTLLTQFAVAETPANNSVISESTPTISWDIEDTSSINYTLIIDNTTAFSSPIVNVTNIEDTNYTLSSGDLPGEGTYYWRVNGTAENNTGIYSFTLDTTSPQPGNLTIENGNYTSSETLNLEWSGFTDDNDIEYYYYNFSNNSGTTQGIQTNNNDAELSNSDEGNISVHVWAEDEGGNIGGSTTDWVIADYTAPQFADWQVFPEKLSYATQNPLNITFEVNEDNLKGVPECRYSVGSKSADWSNSTQKEGNFEFIIKEDWESYAGETLYYECRAEDMAESTTTEGKEEYVIENLYAPEFIKLEDQTAVEKNLISFEIAARDLDNESLDFECDHDDINISRINKTAAEASWVPQNEDVGDNKVNFSVTDGYNTTTESINIFVNGTNDPPQLKEIPDIEGYLHEPINATVKATDPDNENSANFDDQFRGVFTADKSWLREGDEIKSMFNKSSNEYVGVLNFTPLRSHRGTHNITITITDEEGGSDEESFTLDVGYCGDTDSAGEPKCDSDYEDCETCPEDCGPCSEDDTDSLAIVTPDRNCLNETITLSAYKLYERATCETQGEIIGGKEICEIIDGATINVYILEEGEWKEHSELVTNENGSVSFNPEKEGDYKLVGEYESYKKANKFIEVNNCAFEEEKDRSENKSENKSEKTKDDKTKDDNNNTEEKSPEEEKPSGINEEKVEKASLFEVILYYVIIPILVAALIFAMFVYYEKEKNNKAWLLKLRIWGLKKKKEIIALFRAQWVRLREKLGY